MPKFTFEISQHELDAICEIQGYPKGDREKEDAIVENIIIDGIMEYTGIGNGDMRVSRG